MREWGRIAAVFIALGTSLFLLLGLHVGVASAGLKDQVYTNFLDNGSFNSGLAYWEPTGSAIPVGSCPDSHTGCLRIRPPTGCNPCSHYAEQWVYVPESGTFAASVQVYGNWYHVDRLLVYDANGNLIEDHPRVGEGWATIGVTFAASPGYYRVVAAVTFATISNQISYFDNATVTVNGEGPPVALLLDRMVWSASGECPFCTLNGTQAFSGGPINTRNGNLSYQETDLSIPVLGGALEFRRSYASQAVDVYTGILGHGWAHNYDMRLHFTGNAL